MEQPNNSASSRFNVIIRLRPELGDERNELTIEEDMQICVAKLVSQFKIIYNYYF